MNKKNQTALVAVTIAAGLMVGVSASSAAGQLGFIGSGHTSVCMARV